MSFKYRFILSFVSIEIFFILIIVLINFFTIDNFSKKFHDEKIYSTKLLVSELLKSPISVYDLATIDNVVLTAKTIEGVKSIVVVDTNKVILSNDYSFNKFLDLDSLLKIQNEKIIKVENQNIHIIKNNINIDDVRLGYLYILFDISHDLEVIENNKHKTILLVLIEILLSTIIAFFVGRKLTFKLLKLKNVANKLAKDSSVEIPFTETKDEIGILANALNNMNKEIILDKKKEKLLQQQSKLATMGEMIGNIAHQWRQPLSAITSSASSIKLQKDLGLLDDKTLDDFTQNIINSSNYLSETINDFREFFKQDKEKENFKISELLDKNLAMINGMINSSETKLIIDIKEDIEIFCFKNELLQAIINIINNAKDALVSNNDKTNRLIFLNTHKEENFLVICIKDNAGGIPEHIKNKIFDPYFTTKHQSQGTGIGLYMTHSIICENLKGKLEEKNVEYTYKEQKHKGAKFDIFIPLKEM